jgi:hypothetical protein
MPEHMLDNARAVVHAERRVPGYWRVTFDNPPFNLYDPPGSSPAESSILVS